VFPAYEYRECAGCAAKQSYNSAAAPGILRPTPFEREEELDSGWGEQCETEEVELYEHIMEGWFIGTGVF
jgi:hypothetical protein